LKQGQQKPVVTRRPWEDLTLPEENLKELIQATLDKGATLRMKAKGQSMLPFIHSGDKLTLEPLTQKKLSIGDVVLFCHPGRGNLMAHRIIARKQTSYLIKPDNSNLANDGWVPVEVIIGRVKGVERAEKKIRIGLGSERLLIAFLSKHGILRPLIIYLSRIKGKL
jgi:hypothetical protein